MKYFSGFCLKNEKYLFNDYLEDREFVVAGFSYGAQKAIDYVLTTSYRVDKIQLLSPAYFNYSDKIINLNLNAFKKNKEIYIKNFLSKAGFYDTNLISNCTEIELYNLFTFNWEKIFEIKDIKIEIFLGEFDKILPFKEVYKFFSVFDIYLIKKANHFLRR